MSAHQPILPSKAIERVEAVGLSEAGKLLADFAAAGLIKTYALARVTTPTGQSPKTIRDAAIPVAIWQRITSEGKVADALNGGTVRLAGSGLIGGEPDVQLTGISFSEASLSKVLARYCAQAKPRASIGKPVPASASQLKPAAEPPAEAKAAPKPKAPPPILPGDLVASIAQTMQVTGLGRTKINELMSDGTLGKKKLGRRTLITVESIERLVGSKVH